MSRQERRYRVYVIRLKNSVWKKSRKYREANPQYEEGRPHVYVGSTGKTAEARFERHRLGGPGTNSLVRRFGKRLSTSEYEDLPTFPDRASAEQLEGEKARELKARGWGVWYNADPVKLGLTRAKLRRYADTVLELGDPPVLEVDLRQSLSHEELERVRQTAGASEFTVITAENPRGSPGAPEANEAANEALREALQGAELPFMAAAGRDPEGTHREASFLVRGPSEPVLALAREFEQDAVFRFDGNRFLLIESASGKEHSLPLEDS